MRSVIRHPVTFKGSRLARWILKMLGWRLDFEGFPTRQGVAIVYPHTSNWDFPIGMLAKWALGIPAHFWGKDSLFKFPVIGAWMRWVGGIPIDRGSSRGVVGQMVHVFEQHKQNDQLLWLALAPEGTRSHTPGWRSGFYQLALGAQVPLALVKLDWGQRRFTVMDFYELTGLRTVVFNAEGADILSYPKALPEFCRLVRSSPADGSRPLFCGNISAANQV